MKRARYKTLENGDYFGRAPGLAGAWANARTLDKCREELREVLEEWLVLKIRDNDPIPRIGRVALPQRSA
jgi:predicted RNase H-like HicB family nuclease